MENERKVTVTALLKPKTLALVSDENLFAILEDLQKSTTNLFNEAWRRGLQKELAEKAMQMKHDGPTVI
jgi:hypothetical protein